jgi:hypothetical protein
MPRHAVNYDPDEIEDEAPKIIKGGRPPMVVTDVMRRTVRAMAGYGIKHSDICKVIGCHKEALYKYFREELDKAIVEANAQVAQSLFLRATKGEGKDAVTAQIFWLKCNAGWKETSRIEVTGKDGAPIENIHKLVNDPIEAARAYQRLMSEDKIIEGEVAVS